MVSVHGSALKGYEAAAGTYVAGRPDYPPEAARWLAEIVGLAPGRRVLEIGAGTGKFVGLLKETGVKVLALEPVAAMRAELAKRHGEVEILAGAAEAIPLPDASVDAVVCAQAFHWFATKKALAEIRRVLVPGGVLGLIWNVRDETVPWVAALSAITDAIETDAPRYKTGAWRRLFPAEGFRAVDERHVRHAHVGSPEQVIVQRTLSVSFIAALPADRRAAVESRVRALIETTPELAGRAEIAFPYETAMFAYRKSQE
jgi:SAM-dependent methyltransferase